MAIECLRAAGFVSSLRIDEPRHEGRAAVCHYNVKGESHDGQSHNRLNKKLFFLLL